jgi:hypothetical protein
MGYGRPGSAASRWCCSRRDQPCSDATSVRFEVVIICAVRSGYAICAYAAGPQVDLNRIVNHPTPSKLALALWADPDINGVRWKGQTFP